MPNVPVEYLIWNKSEQHEVGVIIAETVEDAVEQAHAWAVGIGWEKWELVRRDDKDHVVAYYPDIEGGSVIKITDVS